MNINFQRDPSQEREIAPGYVALPCPPGTKPTNGLIRPTINGKHLYCRVLIRRKRHYNMTDEVYEKIYGHSPEVHE